MERPASPAAVGSPSAHAALAMAVTDGRSGNVRQADALLRALGIEPARHCTLVARTPWRVFAPLRLPGSRSAFGAAFVEALARPPRLAIGCGRQAALATRLLRARGARAVQILDPRIDPAHWDLVIAPEHDRLRGPNVLTLLGSLNPVDEPWLARAREAFATFADLPRPRTAVLLGGPTRHVRFDQAAFATFAATLDAALARVGGSLLVTTSPRTPGALREAVRHRFAGTPGFAWTGPHDGGNPYPGLLAWADRIVCSADSVNMISEACATSVPVHVFDPAGARGRVRLFLDALLARGRVRAMDRTLARFDVEPLRESTRIAAEVRARLGI